MTRRAAAALGVDFHSSDCVLDADGNMIPVDINKTPYWRSGPERILEHLRLGLDALTGER